jgi:hypothetical protein
MRDGEWRSAGRHRHRWLKVKPLRPELRWTWKVGLAIVPIAFQFSSFLPLTLFAWALARALSIPWTGAAVIDQPNGLLWLVLFLGVGWLFQLGGVALGFCLNGQVLRHYLGLPWDAIPQTGLCPEVVVRWLEGIELRSKPSKHTTGGNDPLFDPELDFPV